MEAEALMQKGVTRGDSELYTVKAYVIAFEPRLDEYGQPNLRLVVEYFSCSHPIHTAGESGPL
jgi:hypothetical protein